MKATRAGAIVAAVLAAELLVLAALVKSDVTAAGNETARFATIQMLVEHGTFSIEGSAFPTVDKVRIDGRFYSDKPPLLTCWVAGLYWPLNRLLGLDFRGNFHLLVVLSTLLGVTGFCVLLSFLFRKRLVGIGVTPPASLALAVAVVLCTWILSFGTTLNNHTPAACLLFALLFALDDLVRRPRPAGALGAGLLAGLLLGLELPTGGVFAAVGGVLLLRARRPVDWRVVGTYLAGFAGVAAMLAALNWIAHGDLRPAYLVPGGYDFPGNIHTRQVAGLHRPDDIASYLFHISFGWRGLFSHMPVLLLGLLFLWRQRRELPGSEAWPAAGALVLLAFYATQTGDYGGWSYGFRFLVPLVPLLFWWACRWAWEGNPPRARRAVAAGLLAIGLVTSAVGALNPWPVVYEGSATRPGAVEEDFRSPLLANLLVYGFETDPTGLLVETLGRERHGGEQTLRYLERALGNLGRRDLAPLRELAREWSREARAPEPQRR